MTETLLEVRELKKYFPVKSGFLFKSGDHVHAVDGVSLSVKPGRTLGLVGESGCGKTTTGKTILKLTEPTGGQIFFKGENITDLTRPEMKRVRRQMQMIFQDPFSSLNPRHTIGSILASPLEIHGLADEKNMEEIISGLLNKVGLSSEAMRRYPHEFSGGQRQRIGIARALALYPELIIADEPVSALDVSIQAQIINLMKDLQEELGLAYIIIAHDLSIISHISDEIAVMYLGKIVEKASSADLYAEPLHPYSRALISAVPVPDPEFKKKRMILKGDVPSPITPPAGCRFHPRCPHRFEPCDKEEPFLRSIGKENRLVACHLKL
ncbi:ABC transporter ATP-binding protein [Desulfospira joergensenii]|uniref:ABC transporter ATP-binding protein n=1 Tax=Desulfospira joergensenii TaxID=53329 RepID=UPI0003B40211|nr:dipeptide ABC transporter ATP-binding protein [Desulfospira joergensenii]